MLAKPAEQASSLLGSSPAFRRPKFGPGEIQFAEKGIEHIYEQRVRSGLGSGAS